jgi:uncharacterized protein YndB with AHSA1/START domain
VLPSVSKRVAGDFSHTVEVKMTTEAHTNADFRSASVTRKPPKAAVDGVAGIILANAEVFGTPDQVFRALMTNEVEKWWTIPGVYHLKDWNADLRIQGPWSVTVELHDGRQLNEWGEFCALEIVNNIVMTRRFGANPLIGERETTLTYRFEPSAHGTLVTVREEGFIGRPHAAHGNAENWEKVLGWLDRYLSQGHPLEEMTMAKVILGNHTAVIAARSEQDRIRKFYCDVGCTTRK